MTITLRDQQSRDAASLPLPGKRQAVGRNLLLSSLGMALPVIASLLALPVTVQGLGAARFGVLSLLLGVFAYISLLDLGLGTAVSYRVAHMIHEAADAARVRATVRSATIAALVTGALAATAFSLSARWLCTVILGSDFAHLAEATDCLRMLAASLPLVFVAAVFSGVLIAHEAFGPLNRTRVPFGVLIAIAPALAAVCGADLVVAAELLLAIRVGVAAIQARQCARVLPALWRPAPGGSFRLDLLTLLRFGGWTTVSSMVGPVMVYMDRFYLAAATSPSQVAGYVATYELASKLLLPPALVVQIFFPLLIGARVRDVAESEQLFSRLASGVALLCFLPAALLAATAPELLGRWLPAVASSESTAALQILCGGALINCVSQVFVLQVQSLGRTKAIAVAHLAQLPVYLLLLWWSAVHFGLVGVALAWSLRTAADAILFCGMAASTVGAQARTRLWRTLVVTLALSLILAGLTQVGSVASRALTLAVPLVFLLIWGKRLLPWPKDAGLASLVRRGTSA
ncbi:oligosaccharide flippase family protein [Ramlibacter sp.]|uniref:oligosaccharide flippase family protein n=1 Tax=Ramlibacter sp. TaxID=1917967 RepID=UPI0026344C6A|nr:oligosaccharide flippase family protein [Ramlibacter sp.]MDB5954975.1 hypothetical protein [Ramlibacter sp.]